VTGFTLEGLLGRRGKLRSVGESESHSAREKSCKMSFIYFVDTLLGATPFYLFVAKWFQVEHLNVNGKNRNNGRLLSILLKKGFYLPIAERKILKSIHFFD